ncbi:MAG: hypothetical protein H7333_03385 [Bdellovibrionales bacterium]|nr:hypothetical protein [Oligoflexia bacterium]
MRELLFIAAALSGSTALATPTIYPTRPGVLAQIKTNDQVNSKFIMDNHDDTAFYVLPPQKAYAYATSISAANANLGFCQDMINIQAAGHTITERLKDINKQHDDFRPIIDAAQERYNAAQGALDAYTQSETVAAQIASLNDSITTNQTRLDALYKSLNTCDSDCKALYSEVRALQNSNRDLSKTRLDLINQNRTAANKIAQLQATANTASAGLRSAESRSANIVKGKSELLSAFKELFSTYAVLDGGTATFQFEGDWAKQVETLRRLNPGKHFEQVGTYGVKIDASVINSDAVTLVSMPAFLSSTVDGRTNQSSTIDVGSYPEQFMANVRLSLAGACPIVHPAAFQIGSIEAGKVKLGVSVKYDFDSAFQTKINCLYDEKEMYSKVLSGGSSGALFWKSNWSKMNISDIKTTTFACDWDGLQGATMNFSERRKFEVDALNYAITRMLMKYATPQEIAVNAVPVPTSGLSEVGEGLNRLCGATNIYCAAGSWALKGFDSIFAGGSSTSSGNSTTSSKVTLRWDENLTYPVSGQTNFNTDRVL